VVRQLVGERHQLFSWCAAGSSGTQGCKTPERAPRPRPAASAHQARAGRLTAAGHHAPVIKRAVADQQHAHHRDQADPSLPPGQPRRICNCLHADRRDFRSRPSSRSRPVHPPRRSSPTRVSPADGPSGSSPSGRRARGRFSSSRDRQDLLQVATADDLACCSFAIRCPYRAEVRLECDGLIARLAAEPAVPATNLLDDLADQLTRPRRRAGSRSCGHAAGARWAGRSRFERQCGRTLELLA
jgi:hypothetical protein